MRKRYLFLLALFVNVNALANQQHKLVLGIDRHFEQAQNLGVHLGYQWQFTENLEFETTYLIHDEIKIELNDSQYQGDVSRASIGVNFLKRYNNKISALAGGGISAITKSNNENLVKQGAIAPYFRMAMRYEFSPKFALELGQSSYFDGQILDTNHNVFAQINWQFTGQSGQGYKHKKQPHAKAKQVNKEKRSQATQAKATVTNDSSQWHCQLGAYSNNKNAMVAKKHWQQRVRDLGLHVLKDDNLYRLLTQGKTTKEDAMKATAMIKSASITPCYYIKLPGIK